MSVTAQQVFNIAMGLLDELSSNGTVNPTDTSDYSARAPSILTVGQTLLLPMGEVFATHEISNSPIPNLLGDMYDVHEFKGEEDSFQAVGARAFYFEATGLAVVYVEEENGGVWSLLRTITNVPSGDSFIANKGVITPTLPDNNVRLRFSGTYFYRCKNIALFDAPFEEDADVPDYRPWIKKSMPADFKSISQIITEVGSTYIKSGNYKWEGRSDLYISYDFEGEIRIEYKPVLAVISSLTQTLQIDDTTAIACLPYYLAAELMETENPDLASKLTDKYLAAKNEARRKAPKGETTVENVYGGFECF